MNTAAAARCLESREVGARLVEGPWQFIAKGRWGVPAVGFMSKCVRPDYVLEEDGSAMKWIKPRSEDRHEESDPLAVAR